MPGRSTGLEKESGRAKVSTSGRFIAQDSKRWSARPPKRWETIMSKHRKFRVLIGATAVALVLVGCSSGTSTTPRSSTTTEAPTSTIPETTSTDTPATTTAPTTEAPATTTTATTTEAPTTAAADTEAPSAPTGLVCLGAGGGSGEVALEWDAPAADEGVTTVRIYVKEPGGSFTRIEKRTAPDELLEVTPTRWRADAYPVWPEAAVEVAVTHGDAAGNESGWNPIDVYDAYNAAPCDSGVPVAPTILAALRGAGSLEVDLRVEASAIDIVSWNVSVDQGSGFVPLSILAVSDAGTPGQVSITVGEVDWTASATYRVTASDGHGNTSSAGERSCGPISPGDVAC
ncbi:MAG: hypothetical protein ACI9C1_000854 [Candidatus Aldehydirespiratoraceae bacterium]|jgi:hypothetical protein